jgi:hypothetical protein
MNVVILILGCMVILIVLLYAIYLVVVVVTIFFSVITDCINCIKLMRTVQEEPVLELPRVIVVVNADDTVSLASVLG